MGVKFTFYQKKKKLEPKSPDIGENWINPYCDEKLSRAYMNQCSTPIIDLTKSVIYEREEANYV